MSRRTGLALEILSKADDDFVDLVELLYGEAVDPELLLEDVYKGSPDSSEVHTPGNFKRNTAFAGTLAGAALGVKELKGKGPAAIQAIRTGKGLLVPAKMISPRSAATGVGTASLALGADALASDELKPAKRQRASVNKAVPLSDLSQGIERGMKSLIPTDHPVVQRVLQQAGVAGRNAKAGAKTSRTGGLLRPPKDTAVDSGAYQLGAAAGNLANAATSSPGAKAATATGVGAAALRANSKRKQKNAAQLGEYDDYPPVAKSGDIEVVWSGEISKFDDDKRLAFGWASVVELDGMPVVDRQGDVITPEDMEDAAYDYVLKSRIGGDMHRRTWDDRPHHVSDLVESFVVTDEKVEKMGLPEDTPRGWWVGFKVHDDDTWDLVRKQGRTGFSIHGRGRRSDIPLDTVMGYA